MQTVTFFNMRSSRGEPPQLTEEGLRFFAIIGWEPEYRQSEGRMVLTGRSFQAIESAWKTRCEEATISTGA